jgi:hypothetical protein
MKMNQNQQMIVTMLSIIWRGIPGDYKSRYRMSIWEQFENEIRSAAYTSSLAKFINQICLHLRVSLGTNKEERAVLEAILANADDKKFLKSLREETTLLVLMVRLDNQERNEEKKKKMDERIAWEWELFHEKKDGEENA